MALRTALVDRARIYSRRAVAARRVEGSSHMVDDVGPLIRARLQLPMAPAAIEPPRGRNRAVRTVPSLMLFAHDVEGNEVHVTTEHHLGIFSREQFGEGVEVLFKVTADAEPIRKKRRVIGWIVSVQRVEDHALEPLAGGIA